METILLWGVTEGRGSNIGGQIAEYLRHAGKSVVVAGRVSSAVALNLISQELNLKSPYLSDYPIDGKSYSEYLEANLVSTVISFVGCGYSDNTLLISDAKVADMMDSNVHVPIDIIRKSIPYLKTLETESKIIVANSIAGIVAEEGAPIYSATKFALRGYIDSLRKELRVYRNLTISSLFFQNVQRCGIKSLSDSIDVSLGNNCSFDFIIN